MAAKYSAKRYEVFSAAAAMALDHLMKEESLDSKTEDQLASILEVTPHAAGSILRRSYISPTDLGALCDTLGVDVGITIRKINGEEVTFFPAMNFGVESVAKATRPAKQEVPASETVDHTYGEGLYIGED